MNLDIKKLKDALQIYDDERWKLNKLIRDLEEIPKMQAVVGKYFKCQNSYGRNGQWWMYFYVKGYKDGSLITDVFEEDYCSKIEIIFDRTEYGTFFNNPHYIEIKKLEYNAAAKLILNKLHKKLIIK